MNEARDSTVIDRSVLRDALNDVVGNSLRPVCVGLALFYALLAVWYWLRLTGPAEMTMSMSTALLSVGLLVGAVWFERNRVPPWLAHPAAAVIGVAIIINCLFLLVSIPQARMTTNLMIAQLGFGCLLLSVRWFVGLAVLSLLGWGFIAGGRTDDPDWHHFGLALGEATLFGALVLFVRIRAYRNIQELHIRDQHMMAHLKEANEAALVAVKAKSEFLANMSHEIRTPMTAMLGMTELLQMSKLDDAQTEYAVTIERSGNTLLQLVNDILDFSKVEAGQIKLEDVRMDLGELLNDVQAMLSVKAKQRRLSFEIEVQPGIALRYRGDPTRLKQVLVNLAGNAIKFTPSGSVRMVARNSLQEDGCGLLEIDVIDTGIGIEAAQLDNVFEAFTQADASTTRKFGGTGLGLTISNQLTRLMGGELRVKSEPGKGSTFTVSIPLVVADGMLSLIPDSMPANTLYCGRVLLVEDNLDNQKIARELLKRLGMEVELVNDGEQALARLAQSPFDLVFMDCHMPNMNGFDATREIRRREEEQGKHTTIVALTASVLPEERDRCLEVGMDDYVAKPFSRRDLQAVLDRWLAA